MPELVTEAIVGLRLVHEPPTVGVTVVNEPAHIEDGPDMLPTGFELTVTNAEALEIQPVLLSVNVNVEVPEATAVIIPAFVMVATEGLLLTQIPPVEGKIDVVPPIHIE